MADHAPDTITGGAHAAQAHDSALKHVSGAALYIDDLPEPSGLAHVYVAGAEHARARVRALDLAAVKAAPGVIAVLTAADVPGVNDIGPVKPDEPLFVTDRVDFHGQVLFAVIGESRDAARRAARLGKVDYEPLPPVLDAAEAQAGGRVVDDSHVMTRGDADAALVRAPHRLKGRIAIGGQDHFYLEGQVSMALPQEDGDMLIHCSTQHPSEVQHAVARVLGHADNAVTVEVRRLGGGFGGKETQAAQWAAIAALAARATGRAAKIRLDRDDDMIMTGKRHDFIAEYDVGFADDGRITGIDIALTARCGFSADLSGAICDRAMFHADNGYYLENVRVTGHRARTNTVSATAFRGFGGPQGMMVIEHALDAIAHRLGLDPLAARKRNLYGPAPRDVTPYHMTVTDNDLPEIIDEVETRADYARRRREIAAFNRRSPVLKKGLALTPVKFGISFTTQHLNQAGALIQLYADGSVQLNHGGTEMGQGLFVKVAQVVAEELQIDLSRIKLTATNTGKVPNTSATAASSGSDLNGMAAQVAARKLKTRLTAFAAEHHGVDREAVRFAANQVWVGDRAVAFTDLVRAAYFARVPLSATGFYRTPKIHYDRERAAGRPFLYFAYGAAVSEVMIDSLSGEYKVTRVDIVHETGASLNPAIDRGQIEGGFIQGMGWLTGEELVWDDRGRLLTHAPSTYKIPTCGDRPEAFAIHLRATTPNREPTVHRSKAVGEPPLMLAISVFRALADAVMAAAGGQVFPDLDAPATPERVLMAIERAKARARATAVAAK